MTINLLTGEQYPPSPTDYITKIAPVAPSGDCPKWRAFLKRITAGDDDLQAYGYTALMHLRAPKHALPTE